MSDRINEIFAAKAQAVLAKGPSLPGSTESKFAETLAGTSLNTKLKWDPRAACWTEWTGTHWQTSADKIPAALLAGVMRHVADGVEGKLFDKKEASQLERIHAVRLIGVALAGQPGMKLSTETDPPGVMAFPRGVLDLRTGEWLAHDPVRPITKCCPVDPGPSCVRWERILAQLVSCAGADYGAVHRFLGSSLLGIPADRKLLWLRGPGADGKSVLVRTIRCALGGHGSVVPAEVFGDGARGAHGHELASGLSDCRLACALEVGTRLNWLLLKSLSGGDAQVSKRLYGRATTAERPPHITIASNDPPTPPDAAAADRVLLVNFTPVIEPDESIVQVLAQPGPERDELAGACLLWLLTGCASFLELGIGPHTPFGVQPAGPARWWSECVTGGQIIPKRGACSLAEAGAHYGAWASTNDQESATPRTLARFLRSVVSAKHTETGATYTATLVCPG